jgi:hypothetical protein
MNYQRNVNSILPTELPHKFSYIVAILIHNYFESPNMYTSVEFFFCQPKCIWLNEGYFACMNIQGDFESCADILITSYWLHVELGKNIEKFYVKK